MSKPKQNIQFECRGNTIHGYLAEPVDYAGPAVLVIQEWWGLTDHIASIVDRLAEEGFVAMAPDLYGGRVTHDADEAAELMNALPMKEAVSKLAGAVDFLHDHQAVNSEQVYAMGFCMGGGFVLGLAHEVENKLGGLVTYYGVGTNDIPLENICCPVLMHHGEDDAFVSAEDTRKLARRIADTAGGAVDLNIYPGAGHAFFNDDDLLGTYDEKLAKRSWDSTLQFLRQHS